MSSDYAVAAFVILARVCVRIPLKNYDARELLCRLKSDIADAAVFNRFTSPASGFFAAATWAKLGVELANELLTDNDNASR